MIKLKHILQEIEADDFANQLKTLAIEHLKAEVKKLEHDLEKEFPELEELSIYLSSNGSLYLDSIKVKELKRRQGIGSKVLHKIKKFADDHDLYVVLHPFAVRGFKKKLDKFYKGHGFIPNKGRKKLYQYSHMFYPTMYRRPASKELKEKMSPYPDVSINDKKRGYIGIVSNGRVYGYDEMVPNPMQIDHSEIEYGARHGRFRYFVERPRNIVIWTDFPPTNEEKQIVEDWLAKKGEHVRRHIDYNEYAQLIER